MARKGERMPDETRARIAAALRGKPKSEAHRAAISENYWKVQFTPEALERIAEVMDLGPVDRTKVNRDDEQEWIVDVLLTKPQAPCREVEPRCWTDRDLDEMAGTKCTPKVDMWRRDPWVREWTEREYRRM